MNLFFSLFKNTFQNIEYLKIDFIGKFDIFPLFLFLENIFALLLYFGVSFIVGKKIKRLLYKERTIPYELILNIALGYILIGSLLGLLGFFSILKPTFIYIILSTLALLSLIPVKNLFLNLNLLKIELKKIISDLHKNRIIFFVVTAFILLSLVNLINPETREDQYHVDLPRIFLREETNMITPKEDLHVSGSPLLSEMYYLVPIQLIGKESARYIHFGFYILCIIALFSFSQLQKYKFAKFVPIIFVTSPVILHESSSAYTDFQWILCFLLSILLLHSRTKINSRILVLVGILLGGMISAKLWTIILILPFSLYVFYRISRRKYTNIFSKLILLITPIILVSGIWFIRAYILTGNPLYPAFLNEIKIDNTIDKYSVSSYFTLNTSLINPLKNLNVFSPLFFLGIIFVMLKIKSAVKIFKQSSLFFLAFLVFLTYLFLNYPYGRYLIGTYILLIFVSSLGLTFFTKTRAVLITSLVIFSYYLINSVLVLPYTFSIADKNSYLTRILIRDNSSYYDFAQKFDIHINTTDKVAMYNFHGYYYADFNYIDVNFIFDRNNKSIEKLKSSGVTKLLIRGGDMAWFCNKLSITDCSDSKYNLISNYLVYPYYYLYSIK